MIPLAINRSVTAAVTATSAVLSAEMATDELWAYVCTSASWIKQGSVASPPTAVAANGNCYVPANTTVILHGIAGAKLAAIRASADGVACLTPVIRL